MPTFDQVKPTAYRLASINVPKISDPHDLPNVYRNTTDNRPFMLYGPSSPTYADLCYAVESERFDKVQSVVV